ncbi:hypothetical protein [Bradyrhizobium liaoningense]|uniref:hypothetical protein n=1 Tax=Bradyrhizobium liaoningense TaxID=43992 RepID=UPI003D9AE603
MRQEQTRDQNGESDGQRPAAHPEQLVNISLNCIRSIRKIVTKGFVELQRRFRLRISVRMMNSNPDCLPARELSSPADNVFFRLSIEVTLAKRERIERVKELGDVVDPKLDHLFGCLGNHRLSLLRIAFGHDPKDRVVGIDAGHRADVSNKQELRDLADGGVGVDRQNGETITSRACMTTLRINRSVSIYRHLAGLGAVEIDRDQATGLAERSELSIFEGGDPND